MLVFTGLTFLPRSAGSHSFRHTWTVHYFTSSIFLFPIWIKMSSFYMMQLHWDSNTAVLFWIPEVLVQYLKLEKNSYFVDVSSHGTLSAPLQGWGGAKHWPTGSPQERQPHTPHWPLTPAAHHLPGSGPFTPERWDYCLGRCTSPGWENAFSGD